MRDIIYNELMKAYAPGNTTDPVYVANTNDKLAGAIADYLDSEDEWFSREVFERVRNRIALVWASPPGQAESVAGNILNVLTLDREHDE